jgi:phage recombination protein Bet
MSNQLAIPEAAVSAGINEGVWNALSTSVYPGANPDSIILAFQYCKARNLDPLKKPVHIVPMSVKDAKTGRYSWRDVIMPGIQELRTTASRTNLMAGMEPPVFGPIIEVPVTDNPEVKDPYVLHVPESCTVVIYRLDAHGTPRPYVHVEFFEEAVARTKDGAINSMWRKRSRGQLLKCAEAGALRKAFPEELGGILSAEEMEGKTLGGDGAAPPIEGEFAEVETGDIPMPEETDDAQQAEPPAAEAAAPAPAPAKAATKATGKGEAKYAVQDKPKDEAPAKGNASITLDAGPLRVLTSRLASSNLTESDLLAGFGKDVNIGNINEALTWIKDNAK